MPEGIILPVALKICLLVDCKSREVCSDQVCRMLVFVAEFEEALKVGEKLGTLNFIVTGKVLNGYFELM